MSVEKLSWALRQCVKPASKKLVLIALGDACPADGFAFPSTETIVRTTSLNRKTVIKCLDDLQSDGLISDTGNRTGATGQIKVFRINDGTFLGPGGGPYPNHTENGSLSISKAPNFTYKGSQKRDGEGSQKRDTERKEELEEERKEEGVRELPEKFKTSRMVGKWGMWMNARRGMKKPKSWILLFNEQLEWLSTFDEPTAHEILSASIRNGWQGLFPPKQRYQSNDTMPLFAQTKLIEEAIQKHKANRDGSYFDSQCTDQDRQNLKALRTKLKDVKDQQLNGIISK